MQVSTTFSIEGSRIIQYKGVVRGIVVRAPTISQGIFGGLKAIVGGQIGAYTEMCEQARQQAYDRCQLCPPLDRSPDDWRSVYDGNK